ERQRRLDRGWGDPPARLGTRRRPDPRVRHRRLRDRSGGDPAPAGREPGRGPPARRFAEYRLGAGRDDPDEWPGHAGLYRGDGAVSGPEVITLGCRLNMAESEAMRALASGEDDLIIV